MSAAAVPSAGARPAAAALSDRFLAALPLLALFTWLALVHAWQAWLVPSPWLFSDELEHTQLARSLAETGETLRRGSPYPMSSLWVALAAPAWLIDDVQTAYGVVKFTSAIVMTSVVFPAYALARLIAGPWASLFAAAAAGAIPAFMYSGLMLQEPLAYPFATLCLYVFVRALAAPTYRWVLGALALALVAGRVRPQLAILLGVLLLAGAVVWLRSERGRRLRARLSTWDKVGAGLLLVGLAIVGNEWMSHRSEPWQQTTRYWKHRMVDYALDAGGALTIGIGILPVVAGLALVAVALVRGETPAVRAFAAVAAATIVVFAFYTGLKAAWLSTHAFGRIPERNLIYLAPLFFAATAYWMSRGRLHAAAVGAAAAFAAVLLVQTPYELGYPYFEAPGFSILALANRHLAWDAPTIQAGCWSRSRSRSCSFSVRARSCDGRARTAPSPRSPPCSSSRGTSPAARPRRRGRASRARSCSAATRRPSTGSTAPPAASGRSSSGSRSRIRTSSTCSSSGTAPCRRCGASTGRRRAPGRR